MNDIKLRIDNESYGSTIDFSVVNKDLELEAGLKTAVIVSLFTDKRISPLEAWTADASLRGWYGDALNEIEGDLWGSKLWLLDRGKQTQETLTLAEEYTKDALAWMIEDGVAASIECEPSFSASGFILLKITITKPDGASLDYTFDYAWQAENAG